MDLNGIILLDKDPGKTSFECTKIIKNKLNVQKTGHSGTLDKFASGLLIVCINKATSLQNIFMDNEKTYRAKIKFGIVTDTLDPYGKILDKRKVKNFEDEEIRSVLNSFIGEIEQIPPEYSAIRIDGERLYKKKLKGEELVIKPRRVKVINIKLLENLGDEILIEATVSKGTYIRALARDIAQKLGTIGFCSELRRISIGPFNVKDGVKLENVTVKDIVPIKESLNYLPSIKVNDNQAKMILMGIPVDRVIDGMILKNDFNDIKYINVFHNDDIIAILTVEAHKIKYFKVLGSN